MIILHTYEEVTVIIQTKNNTVKLTDAGRTAGFMLWVFTALNYDFYIYYFNHRVNRNTIYSSITLLKAIYI